MNQDKRSSTAARALLVVKIVFGPFSMLSSFVKSLNGTPSATLFEKIKQIEGSTTNAVSRALGAESLPATSAGGICELLEAAKQELAAAFSGRIWQTMSFEFPERFTEKRSSIPQQEFDHLKVRIVVLRRRVNARNIYIERQRSYDEQYHPCFAEARNNYEAAQNAFIEANSRFEQALLAYDKTIHSVSPGAPDQFQQAMARCLSVVKGYVVSKEGVVSLPASAVHPAEEHSALLQATDNLENTFKQLIGAQCAFETANETRLRADHPALSSLLTEIRTVNQRLYDMKEQERVLAEEEDEIKKEHPSVNYYIRPPSTSTPSCDRVRFQEIVLQQQKFMGERYSLVKTLHQLLFVQEREFLRAAKIIFPTIADDVTVHESLSTGQDKFADQNRQYWQLLDFYNNNQKELEKIHGVSDLIWFLQEGFSDEQGERPDDSNSAEIVQWKQRLKEKGALLAELIYDLLSQCEGITRENYPELLKLLGQISETRKLNERYHITTKEQLLTANALFLGIYANQWGINQFVNEDRILFNFITRLLPYEQSSLGKERISVIRENIRDAGLSEEFLRKRSRNLHVINTACSRGKFSAYLASLEPPLPRSKHNPPQEKLLYCT
ncbi:hypothetical protein JYU14_05135 [Simkania negevensis]|uniref:Ras-GEF domain-containing protein n=1 Tax=Simkania negevensis TaxID=83561 RepID=A0ABS3ATA8_9BACT|nr:hypothetical protein [Simkania negevensis]